MSYRSIKQTLNKLLGAPNPCRDDPYDLIKSIINASIPPDVDVLPSPATMLVPANTKFVSTDWLNVPASLSSTTFFTSIQDAINQISVERASINVPYQILLYIGTYNENIVLIPNLTIIGSNRTNTIINGNITYTSTNITPQTLTLNNIQYTGNLVVGGTGGGGFVGQFELNNVTTPSTRTATISLTRVTGGISPPSSFKIVNSILTLLSFLSAGDGLTVYDSAIDATSITFQVGPGDGQSTILGTTITSLSLVITGVSVAFEECNILVSTTFTLSGATLAAINCSFDPSTAQIVADITSQLMLNGSTYNYSMLYNANPITNTVTTSTIACPTDRTLDSMLINYNAAIITDTPYTQVCTLTIPYINDYIITVTPIATVTFPPAPNTLPTAPISVTAQDSTKFTLANPAGTGVDMQVLVTLTQPYYS